MPEPHNNEFEIRTDLVHLSHTPNLTQRNDNQGFQSNVELLKNENKIKNKSNVDFPLR